MRRILPRLIALLLIAFLLNQVYRHTQLPRDLARIDILDSVKLAATRHTILYFAESSNFSYSHQDTDQRRISDFVADYYPGQTVGVVNKGALHAGVYIELLKQIPENSPVNTIIVTMNLRSFGPDWIHSKLESLLQRDLVMLQDRPPLLNRFFLGLKAYDNKSEYKRHLLVKKEWDRPLTELPGQRTPKTVSEWSGGILDGQINPHLDSASRSLAATYIRNFAFTIDTITNPRIKDFDAIAEYARHRGWNLVFNLLSENTAQAATLAGSELSGIMKRNRDLLVKRYQRKGAIVADNLETVDDKDFIDRTWPTEHYTENGRKAVAHQVAVAMKQLFPGEFVDVSTRLIHLNDFEKAIPGFSKPFINTSMAFSGEKSARLDSVRRYSSSFYIRAGKLNELKITEIEASAMLYGDFDPGSLHLVFTVEGNNKTKHWKGFKIPSDTGTPGWKTAGSRFQIPENLDNEDIAKVFLWYTGKSPIFMDDFRVEMMQQTPGK